MWMLVARLVLFGMRTRSARLAARFGPGASAAVAGGSAVAALVTLSDLREQAVIEAGASDPQALDEAARTAARMLGLDGSEVLWPSDRLGNQINPKYFHVNLSNGQAWYTAEYFSRKSVRRFRRRRFGSSFRRTMRATATRIADTRG